LAINNSKAIICVSNNTKRDLLKYYSDLDGKKIYVIYEGVSEDYTPLNIKKEEFLFFVGYRSNYKRFDLAVELAKRSKLPLYFVGGRGINKTEMELLNGSLGDKYKHFSDIANDELNKLYNKAFALIYPSEYEGFGLPILEAMRAGCPVIAHDGSSITEISNGAAMLVKGNKVEEYQECLKQLEDTQVRKEYIDKGLLNSSSFTWEKTFNETFKIYKDLSGN
jgi:mannosyltransferase